LNYKARRRTHERRPSDVQNVASEEMKIHNFWLKAARPALPPTKRLKSDHLDTQVLPHCEKHEERNNFIL